MAIRLTIFVEIIRGSIDRTDHDSATVTARLLPHINTGVSCKFFAIGPLLCRALSRSPHSTLAAISDDSFRIYNHRATVVNSPLGFPYPRLNRRYFAMSFSTKFIYIYKYKYPPYRTVLQIYDYLKYRLMAPEIDRPETAYLLEFSIRSNLFLHQVSP